MNIINYLVDIFRRPREAINMLKKMIIASYQANGGLKINLLYTFLFSMNLYVKYGFLPEEALQYGFLYGDFDKSLIHSYASKKRMLSVQRKINPFAWEMITEDKSIFYSFCDRIDIPIPELYGYLFEDSPGWSFIDSKSIESDEWEFFINNSLPNEFLIKPALGCYGRRIKTFTRNVDTFVDEAMVKWNAKEIYDFMAKDPTYHCFVIQERLKNHEELIKLSNSSGLQTIRMITHINKFGQCKVIYAYLKPITGDNIVDNQNYGRTGNLLARIDIDKGILQYAVYMTQNPYGIRMVKQHPDSKVQFEGFPIPEWKKACELAIHTAQKFSPIRTIGWDIAVTPNGPVIIEGNITWDPPKFGDIQGIIEELEM